MPRVYRSAGRGDGDHCFQRGCRSAGCQR
jgi:hypothetical protein